MYYSALLKIIQKSMSQRKRVLKKVQNVFFKGFLKTNYIVKRFGVFVGNKGVLVWITPYTLTS